VWLETDNADFCSDERYTELSHHEALALWDECKKALGL
jgi:hypothetical protein